MSAHRDREPTPYRFVCRGEEALLVELMRAIREAAQREQASRTPIARLLRDRRERIACDWTDGG